MSPEILDYRSGTDFIFSIPLAFIGIVLLTWTPLGRWRIIGALILLGSVHNLFTFHWATLIIALGLLIVIFNFEIGQYALHISFPWNRLHDNDFWLQIGIGLIVLGLLLAFYDWHTFQPLMEQRINGP